MTLDAVFFDLGDTLTDLGEGRGDYEARVLARAGRIYDVLAGGRLALPERAQFCQTVAEGTERHYQIAVNEERGVRIDAVLAQVFAELGLNLDPVLLQASAEAYCRGASGPAPMRIGAPEVLAQLHALGYRMGVISNTIQPGRYLDEGLQRRGIYQYFDARIYSSEVGLAKPHPGIFRAALQALGVPAERAVHVGDRLLHDVGGAQRAGLKAILIHVPGRIEESPDIIPDAQINELPELPEVLRRLQD